MRIRKRQDKLPLSSLSPVPLSSLSLSDPYDSGSGKSLIPPVQLILRPTAPAATDDIGNNFKPSDQAATNRAAISRPDTVDQDHPELGISGEETPSNGSSVWTPSRISQSTQVHLSSILGRGGKTLRRNRDDGDEEGGEVEVEEDKNVGTVESKSKSIASPSSNARKRVRGAGAIVLEGSRCSRVNGRGWRCCQTTLVGYSLCEHHLGKGRLRSMTSVRNRRQTKPAKAPLSGSLRAAKEPKREEGEGYAGEKKNKKGMKLGLVKARSMSSLLRQDSNSNNTNSGGATPATADMEAVGSDNLEEGSNIEEEPAPNAGIGAWHCFSES